MATPDMLKQFLERVMSYLDISGEVSCTTKEDAVHLAVSAPERGNLLIGRGGQNLQALEHLARAAWLRMGHVGHRVVVDVNEYRRTKTDAIIAHVKEVAERVRMTRRPETLAVMAASERRVVHTELANYHDLSTESMGQEPERRVVIRPL